jgi:hypothetical protein
MVYKGMKKLTAFEELQSDSKIKELCKVLTMVKLPANQIGMMRRIMRSGIY